MNRLSTAILGSLLIAAVSTLGDFVWATWVPRHRMTYGLIHGAVLFLAIGLFLGAVAGRAATGAILGVVIGAAAAGSFYLLAPMLGFSAMFVSWFGMWVALGLAFAWLIRSSAGAGTVIARGLIAGLASGLAFYLISGIWRPFNPQGWDYAVHFASWTVAYFPGFAALMLHRR